MKNFNFCNNCGKTGHLFHQCKIPITSIGIIVFRKRPNNSTNKTIEYLMIRRKDSLGFVDFMRGKYQLTNTEYIVSLLNKMTIGERNRILNEDFMDLWSYLWGENIGIQYRSEEKTSNEKFNSLKETKLESLINECKEHYEEPEWGFPKGRRNYQEKDLMCAIREFEEETGYNRNDLKIIQNLLPLEEIYTGSNYKSYKHKYYIAFMEHDINPENTFQTSEVSRIEWKSIESLVKKIRPYNLEKIAIIEQLNNILLEYKLYS
jgi:8-oxo-dGTP pyrophosphatase MutT (NUDIX family)